MNIDKSEITIGIVTALPEEYHAVKAILENVEDFSEPDDPSIYTIGQIKVRDNFGGGLHKIALSIPSKMGTIVASAIASHLTRTFTEVKYLFMVGIAGGMPQHVKLGDIIIAKKIVQYDFGKREDGDKFVLKSEPLLASEPLLKRHRYLELQKKQCSWHSYLDSIINLLNEQNLELDFGFERPDNSEKRPNIFCETIGSANTVLKNAQVRDKLSSKYGLYAVEMEASGIADAATMKGLSFMVIRGICDYCDQSKGDNWHGYAAAVAAAYTKALIETIHPKPISKSFPKKNFLIGFTGALLVLILFIGGMYYLHENIALENKLIQEKFAVALGSSFAMIGQSSGEVGKPLFDKSLRELGIPSNQVDELYGKYVSLENAVQSGGLSYYDFQHAKIKLQKLVIARVKILAGKHLIPYIKLGHDLFCLLLILKWWDKLQVKGEPLSTAKECLLSLKNNLKNIELPNSELTEKIYLISATDLTHQKVRNTTTQVLKEIVQFYDMKPQTH